MITAYRPRTHEAAQITQEDAIKAIIIKIMELQPAQAAELVAAVETAAQYITQSKRYDVFSDSGDIAAFIYTAYRKRQDGKRKGINSHD